MGELLDYLVFFWLLLTGAVVGLGSIYEQACKKKREQEERLARQKRQADAWSSDNYSTSASHSYNQSSQHQYRQQQSFEPQYQHQQYNSSQYNANYSSTSQPTSSAYSPADWTRQTGQPADSMGAGLKQTLLDRSYDRLLDAASSYDNQQYQQHQQSAGLAANEYASIPTATGFNASCVDWVNRILYLFYTQPDRYAPIIAEAIYRSLNEKLSNITTSSAEFSHLTVEFLGINRHLSTRPELTNIRTDTESEKSVSAICKIYNERIHFDLTIQRARHLGASIGSAAYPDDRSSFETDEFSQYELVLERLEGKLKSVAMLSEKLIVVQFMEKPDTKILLRPKYQHPHQRQHQQLINEDSLVSMILQTLTQVVIDLYFGDDPDFPDYKQLNRSSSYLNKLNLLKGGASEIKRQIKQEFFGALSAASSDSGKERKVLVKILSARNINYNQNVTCLLEVDSPHQLSLSSTRPANSNPFWDEHFLFSITDKSQELQVEMWDSIGGRAGEHEDTRKGTKLMRSASSARRSKVELTSGGKFLGLVRISVDELRRNPSQQLHLALQSRTQTDSADLSNSVGGELHLELLFLEHSSGSTAGGPLKKSSSSSSISYAQGDVVAVDRKLTPSGYVITTTTITKPATGKLAPSSGRFDQLTVGRNQSPVSSAPTDQSDLDALQLAGDRDQSMSLQTGATDQTGESPVPSQGRMSRSRSRSRSILNAIKKRFSFSRNRSRSLGDRSEPQSPVGSNQQLGDASSVGSRSRSASEASMAGGRAKSVPASRDANEVPVIVINKGRLSDTASAYTFAHPKSQLIIECWEPKSSLGERESGEERNELKYYAISEEVAKQRLSRWRRKGTKLHMVNEHLFVACHLAPSSTCHLCGKVFLRRPGKQGYKCRNCDMLSHKQCHVRVDHLCPHAIRDGLKLEYIDADPPACLMSSTETSGGSSAGTLPRQSSSRTSAKSLRLGAKSISMDVDDR